MCDRRIVNVSGGFADRNARSCRSRNILTVPGLFRQGTVIPRQTRMAKLYFYYSTMNAGKSTSLLQAAHNYAERGLSTLLFIANLDQRAAGRIKSRIGLEADANRFDADTDF